MWGTLGIPIVVVASGFAAALLESLVAGSAGLLFLGLLLLLPKATHLPVLDLSAVTGLTSVVVVCVSLRFAFWRGSSRLRLFLHGPPVCLAAMGAAATPSFAFALTLSGVLLVALLWARLTTAPGVFPGAQWGRRRRTALSISGTACLSSLAAGASGVGFRPLTNHDARLLGEATLPFPPRAMLLGVLLISAVKALSGQTPPLLAGGVALGAIPGLLAALLLRRLLVRK